MQISPVIQLVAGPAHCLCLCEAVASQKSLFLNLIADPDEQCEEEDRQVAFYVWGQGDQGQLGNSTFKTIRKPMLVELPVKF
jgi:hypothetical protein